MSNRSFSLGTIFQYIFLAAVGYVLAGAPLLSVLTGSHATGARSGDGGMGVSPISREKLDSLVVPRNLSCPAHSYRGVHVLNREPLVVYIEGFLGEKEVDKVVELSTPHFQPSTVWTSGQERLDPTVRLSHKAQVPRFPIVQCIEERARAFQGWRPYLFIEKLWAQKYASGGHYSYHYDWSTATKGAGRVSSFMVWLGDQCEGGGTRFPRLRSVSGEWCRFVECRRDRMGAEGAMGGDRKEEEEDTGITFKPIRGNAVFWENIGRDGVGYEESWHAGLPVTSGEKVGLNIWSWYQEGLEMGDEDDGSGYSR